MNSHWTGSRTQLDQVLAREQALRQARRRQQPSVWQAPGYGWATRLARWLGLRRVPTGSALRTAGPSL